MSLNILMISFLTIFTLVYIWVKKSFSFWDKRGIPIVKPSFPFGNLNGLDKIHTSQLIKKVYDTLKESTNDVIGGIFFFTKPMVITLDPEIIKDILVRDFSNFSNRGMYVNEKDDPLSAHLFSIEGAKWKNLRSKLSPTFTSGKMKMMFHTVLNVGDELKKYLEPIALEKSIIEMKDVLSRYSTDVIGTCAFGIDCNSLLNPESEFRRMGAKSLQFKGLKLIKLFFAFTFVSLSKKLGLVITDKSLTKFFLRVTNETVRYREENSIERNDFMNLMIKLKNHENENERVTMNELAAQAFVFFVAGFETSSTTMSFLLYELAMNQEIQEKLRYEIKKTIEKYNGEITYEAVLDIPYLDQVIDETLRKYPAVDSLMRMAENDYKVGKTSHVIPKGMVVLIPAYAIHHDPEYFPDPEKFDPERFSIENKKTRHPFSYLPFGEGPRNCIGLRFGYMQTRIGIIKSLVDFKYSTCEKTPKIITFDPKTTVLVSAGGLWLKIENV